MPRRRTNPTPAVFYGYPPGVIAEWCRVSVRTARLYKLGQRQPSPQTVRLFVLHRDRQVLTPEWRRWVVKRDSIVDPEGNEVPRNWIRGYFLLLQWAHSVAGEHGLVREYRQRLKAIGDGL